MLPAGVAAGAGVGGVLAAGVVAGAGVGGALPAGVAVGAGVGGTGVVAEPIFAAAVVVPGIGIVIDVAMPT